MKFHSKLYIKWIRARLKERNAIATGGTLDARDKSTNRVLFENFPFRKYALVPALHSQLRGCLDNFEIIITQVLSQEQFLKFSSCTSSRVEIS